MLTFLNLLLVLCVCVCVCVSGGVCLGVCVRGCVSGGVVGCVTQQGKLKQKVIWKFNGKRPNVADNTHVRHVRERGGGGSNGCKHLLFFCTTS